MCFNKEKEALRNEIRKGLRNSALSTPGYYSRSSNWYYEDEIVDFIEKRLLEK